MSRYLIITLYFQIHTRGCLDVISDKFEEDLSPLFAAYAIMAVISAMIHLLAAVANGQFILVLTEDEMGQGSLPHKKERADPNNGKQKPLLPKKESNPGPTNQKASSLTTAPFPSYRNDAGNSSVRSAPSQLRKNPQVGENGPYFSSKTSGPI